MKLSDLKSKTPAELLDLAQSLGIENISRAKKQTLIFSILKHKADNDEEVLGDGVEVVTATSTDEEITLSSQWAKEYKLLSSCGSDYHGWSNQRIQIGNLGGLSNLENAIWRYLPCRT